MATGKQKLQNALEGITIGVVHDLEDFRELRRLDGLAEIEEQVRVEFAGRAEEFASWTQVEVEFENHFIDATGQRDSLFDTPQFRFGAALETPTPVAVSGVVLKWRRNDRGETVGALVAIGILATDLSVRVRGQAHLSFQGYGYTPSAVPEDIGG